MGDVSGASAHSRSAAAVRSATAAVGAIVLISLVNPVSVSASDGSAWNPFATQSEKTAAQTYDRTFVREWEANPPRGYPTVSSANIEPMKAAIKRYAEIVADGGWKTVPDGTLQLGMTSAAVAILRERLLSSGDLRETSGYPADFDYYVERAVKRFQASNGLAPTGIVDKRTVAALNVPASARLRQLRTNLSRVGELARSSGKKYVLVNVPSAQIEAIENDRVISRHSGVVGQFDRQTPLLRSAIHELNFNPIWTLPPTVISKDLIPKGREMEKNGQSVLAKYGIDAYAGDGRKLDPKKINWSSSTPNTLVYRQQPGKDNPLGFLKINFHNNHSVYMHDTPSESLFGRNFRAASSGCVRVQGIEQLASWLLASNGDWSAQRIEAIKKAGERLDVKLKKPVPVYFVYITAWATEDGVIQFRRDLYRKDGLGETASTY